ncbi:hypothetical protein IMSAGC006_01782 [Muribaculaceae bacterium]|nr:hypothetical protein IMSAGC006_01782 [Muribaculaceae bacterium]
MIPIDSLGAIVIYGDFYNVETSEEGVAVLHSMIRLMKRKLNNMH